MRAGSRAALQATAGGTVVLALTFAFFVCSPVSARTPWGLGSWKESPGYCAPDPEPRKTPNGIRAPRGAPVALEEHWPGVWGRLGMLGYSQRLGDTVIVRTENIGTVRFVDPQRYRIEQLTAQGWLALGPKVGRVPRRGGGMLLDSARARCFAFRIPTNAAPGLYRVAKPVQYDSPETGERQMLTLIREFQVLSPLLR